jgi:TolB-like protein
VTLAAGTRLGPYEILSPLGAGGMGEVYKARDTRLARHVAIKVLPESFSSDADRLRRFEQEARATSLLNHPNITTVYDVGSHEGAPYVVEELLEGETLRGVLARDRPSFRLVLDNAIGIARGLAAAHDKGIVHRDLKPENVFVTRDARVKILDFGLAKLSSPVGEGSQVATVTRLTEPGILLGTVGYMSPEQATGRNVDHRSDQFSLGAILYELSSGARAFARPTAVETLSAILKDEPPPLERAAPDAPEPLRWIVARCLAKEPAGRYASTEDLARDLETLRDRGRGAAAPPAARPGRRGRSLAAGAFALVLLGILAAWHVARLRQSAPGVEPHGAAIAILPFQNYGGRTEDDYFSDGMTESLTTDLANVAGLLVIAQNSVSQYKNRAVDVRKVGNELGVHYVLEGSVQRSGDSVRVNAQLVDARTGYHLWAQKYDRPMRDIFALQDDISRHITGALRLALRPSRAPAAKPTPTPTLEAYDAYLHGIFNLQQRFDWNRSEAGVSELERAVSLDPGFARAHAALATAYARRAFEGDPQGTWAAKAGVEIEKTLALDPDVAEVYVARATLAWTRSNGFPHESAIADYRRALEANPNLQLAHKGLAGVYYHVGLLEEAVERYRTAARLDPQDLDATYRIPRIHLYQQKYAEALGEFDATPEFRHDFLRPIVLAHQGRVPEALAAARSELTNPTHSKASEKSDAASTLAVMLALTGDAAGAETAIAASIRYGDGVSHFHHAAYNIATAYALMGRQVEAMRFLTRVSEEGMPCYPLFAKDPFLDGLRRNPEFVALLDRMNERWERFRAEL